MSPSFGLPQSTLDEMRAIFARHNKVTKVVVYGSRAKGNYRNGSDIDLTMFGKNLTFQDLSNIHNALDDSSNPYLVNLSIYNHLDNAKLREHIDRVGQVFYYRYEGWKNVKLGDVCAIKTGRKDVKEGNDLGQYPFFTCAKEHTFSDGYSFDCEAILIAGNGAVGQTTYYKGKFEAYQRTYVLSDFNNIEPKLLLFILQGRLMSYLSSMVLGNTIPYIKKGMLQDFEFLLPPLAEQQRIVAKLDAAFAEIDSAIELVDAKQANAQRLKASLLDVSLNDNTAMWKTVKLGDVCELIGGGTPSKRNHNLYGGNIPWATVRDMHSDYLDDTEFCINEEGLTNSSSKVIPKFNVIIASRVGLGKVCLLSQDTAINQDLRGVIPRKENELDAKYLFYWFKNVADKIIDAGRGATVQGVTLPFLKSLELPLPPLAEQQRIVAKLDAAFSEVDTVLSTTSSAKQNYRALKSAILAQQLQSEAA